MDTTIWLYAVVAGDDLKKSPRAKSRLEASRAVVVCPQVINKGCGNLLTQAPFAEPEV